MWAVRVPVGLCLYKREFRILESDQSCVKPSLATSFGFCFLFCKNKGGEPSYPSVQLGRLSELEQMKAEGTDQINRSSFSFTLSFLPSSFPSFFPSFPPSLLPHTDIVETKCDNGETAQKTAAWCDPCVAHSFSHCHVDRGPLYPLSTASRCPARSRY